jgi:hypothetical protein
MTPEPLLTPDQAAILLDQVVYEQLLECIDLDEVSRVEQSLTLLVSELDGMTAERIDELARATLDRALRRLPDQIRRYLRDGAWPSFAGCESCDDDDRSGRRGAARQPATRTRS